MKIILILCITFFLTSCASDKTSQNLYSSSEIGKAIKIKTCTVISSRQVIIRDKKAGDKGEALGYFAGNISSSRRDKPLSGFIAGLIGGAIGRQVSDKLHELDGVEYTVILRNGEERQLVQDIGDGEKILQIGDPCRIQISGNTNRVLSSKYYPKEINRPTNIQFSD